VIQKLLKEAKSGQSVYITEIHRYFGSLDEGKSDSLAIVVELLDGTGYERFDMKLPKLDSLNNEERDFVQSYIQAEVYNIISALGGRSLTFYFDHDRIILAEMVRKIPKAFDIDRKRSERSGYGRSINVTERMIDALLPAGSRFSFRFEDIKLVPTENLSPRPKKNAIDIFKNRTTHLGNQALLGIDVGGTDIKAVLVDNGVVVDYKEYDWFPAAFLRSQQLVGPICLIVRLLQARLWLHRMSKSDQRRERLLVVLAQALDKRAGDQTMEQAIAILKNNGFEENILFDGIGLCFPDVVVKNKIVGGEVYKTRGIRNNPNIDYESDFAELTNLDTRLKTWVKPNGAIKIINDGPMASFTAAIEMAASKDADKVARGVFAHTLGTELGTGWVTDAGKIPDIPLEVYNFIIDLGCWPERNYESDDLRSVNNFNTGIPGTLQKYCSQSGIFRLAVKYFPSERPDLLHELQEKGFLVRKKLEQGDEGWYVPTEPVDQRKPFLEHMMNLPDRERDETNRKIWHEIGISLAVTLLETKRILNPSTDERFLFGRLVKNKTCFALMEEGARSVDPGISFIVAGSNMANTPLMKQLEKHPEFTVAQFAQAIGAVYFASPEN
jgi:hypothetical protein